MSCVVSCDTKPSDCALNSQATSPPFSDLLGEPVCLPLLLLEPTRRGRGEGGGEKERGEDNPWQQCGGCENFKL